MNVQVRILGLFFLVSTLLFGSFVLACRADDEVEGVAAVEITFPEAGEFVRQSRLRVQGRAEGAAHVTVNGVFADVTGGRWEVLVEFEEGPAVVEAVAEDVTDQVEFFVDSRAPILILESPERGLVLDSAEHEASIRVEGRATDEGSGLFIIRIGQEVIEADAEGRFGIDVPLVEGLNEISVTALDHAQNSTTTRRGILYGPLVDPTSPIEAAFSAQILPPALATVGAVIAGYATPEAVMGFVEESFESDAVDIEAIAFDPIDVNITPKNGYLELDLLIQNVRIDGSFKLGDDPIEAYVAIARLRVVLEVEIGATEGGGLAISVRDSRLELDQSNISSNLIEDSQALRNIAVTLAEYVFAEYVEGFLIEELYDPDTLMRRIEFLERSFEFRLSIQDVTVRELGIHLVMNVQMPDEAYKDVPEVAGALNRALGSMTPSTVQAPLKVMTPRTALDRISHGLWRSGLMHQSVVGDTFAGITLPLPLTADGLATLFDGRIRNYADDDTPAAVRMRPLLPPVIEFDSADDVSGVSMRQAEFLLDFILLHPDKPHQTVVTAALFLDVEVDIVIEGSELNLSFKVDARAEVTDEPLFDLDDDDVISLIETILVFVPEIISSFLVITGEADLPWLRFERPELDIHGTQNDRLTVGIGIAPIVLEED
ncbi:MAG: hypothetical protein ACNA8W_08155 [Bradymonadaceae bacterium]